MARIGVTRDDVFAACKNLLKEGAQLTVANVREELGTGSYTTLLPLIDAFKTDHSAAAKAVAENSSLLSALPRELSELGSKLIQDIWWQATSQAQKQIEEVSVQFKKELNDTKSQLQAKTEEFTQAFTDITRLEKELEQTKLESEEAKRGIQQKDGEISLLKSQLREKDTELKSYLERAVAAEKKLEFVKEKGAK